MNTENQFATESCTIEFRTTAETINSIIRQAQEKLMPDQWNEITRTPFKHTNGLFYYDCFVNREDNHCVEICAVPSESSLNNFIASVILCCELKRRGIEFWNTDHGVVLKDIAPDRFKTWLHGPECANEPNIVITNDFEMIYEKPNA